jgi:hypothetical protein
MKLSPKARAALDTVIDRFRSGDLSPVIKIARIELAGDAPATRWSFSNRVLAYLQTGTLDCRGYNQWQAVGRQVVRGSTAAFIFAPLTVRRKKKDRDDDDDGTRAVYGFRTVAVHPIQNTEGDPMSDIDYAPRILPPLIDVTAALDIQLTWEPTPGDRLGSCSLDGKRLTIGSQDPVIFFHELAHACHARLDGQLKIGQDTHQETVAEFTATVLMELYGARNHSGNAWDYIKYYDDDPITAITRALATVEKILALLDSFADPAVP